MSLTDLLVPTYSQMLGALLTWLDRAGAHSSEPDKLLGNRLAPDMLPLSSQVRFCCLQAYEAVARLRGDPLPEIWKQLAEEGQNAGERPGTMDQARAHVAETRSFLSGLGPRALDPEGDRKIAIELPNGMIFDMTGGEYARDWALPQFNFHLITAYGVLRNSGVPLGKADYVQHAFAYLRPGTMPNA